MTDRHHSIREIDLLAYADGLFDTDPGRKAEVEAYLREHPEEAARVRDYADQNDKIRRKSPGRRRCSRSCGAV